MRKFVIPIALVLIVSLSYFVISQPATTTGEFTVGNENPFIVANTFAVQDGASSWDSTTFTTHATSPSFRWKVDDPNPDSLESFICIGTSLGVCDILSETSAGTNNPGDTVQYDASTITLTLSQTDCTATDCSKTFYVQIRVNDGSAEITEQYTFDLIDSVPTTPNSLSVSDNHDQTPDLSWTATDADDGSVNKWPADTLIYNIQVGATAPGDVDYLDASEATPDSTVSSAIPWGTPGATQSVNTVQVRIWTTDNLGINSAYYDTTFDLIDELPTIVELMLSEQSSLSPASHSCISLAQPCSIVPLEGDYTSVNMELTIDDQDGDCSASTHSAQAVLCLQDFTTGGACDPSNNVYRSYTLAYSGSSGTECIFSVSVPTSHPQGIEFFQAPGTYKMYVDADSQAGTGTAWIYNYEWEYLQLQAINYASSVVLGDASIELGQWNPGTSLATMTNFGNALLNLQWEATDAQSPFATGDCGGSSSATCWDITTDPGFQIDDDSTQGSDVGSLTAVDIPEQPTRATFQPSGGLAVCDSMFCDSTLLDETLDTYFHIRPPVGLSPGTYSTEITITM